MSICIHFLVGQRGEGFPPMWDEILTANGTRTAYAAAECWLVDRWNRVRRDSAGYHEPENCEVSNDTFHTQFHFSSLYVVMSCSVATNSTSRSGCNTYTLTLVYCLHLRQTGSPCSRQRTHSLRSTIKPASGWAKIREEQIISLINKNVSFSL